MSTDAYLFVSTTKKQRRSQSSQLLHGLPVGLSSVQYSMRWTIWPITNSRFLPIIFLSNNSPEMDPNFLYIYYHILLLHFPNNPNLVFFHPLSLFDLARANKEFQRCYVPTAHFLLIN